ncbi:MAG: hypothetical protein ACQR33_05345, partial [Candidatus Saccharibacteria bacterium]
RLGDWTPNGRATQNRGDVAPYTQSDLLLDYSDEVLFIAGVHGHDVMGAFMGLLRGSNFDAIDEVLARTIAIFGVMPFLTAVGPASANDLLVMGGVEPVQSDDFDVIEAFLKANRILKWEDDIGRVLDERQITAEELKKAMPRNHDLANLLASIGRRKKRAAKAG